MKAGAIDAPATARYSMIALFADPRTRTCALASASRDGLNEWRSSRCHAPLSAG